MSYDHRFCITRIVDHARPLRLVPKIKKVDLAIDCTDLPYYGDPNTSGVVGGKPKKSASWFFRFATICIVEEGYKLPLGVLPVNPVQEDVKEKDERDSVQSRRDGRGGSEEEMGREDGTVESDGGNITRTPDTSGR